MQIPLEEHDRRRGFDDACRRIRPCVYWRPVWNVLEDEGFRLLLVNPARGNALAGRKSDGRDARRFAEYLQDRRLDASFVPSMEVRLLRPCSGAELLEQRITNPARATKKTRSATRSSRSRRRAFAASGVECINVSRGTAANERSFRYSSGWSYLPKRRTQMFLKRTGEP